MAVAAPPAHPITITVPIPETVKQGYLEVKKVGTGEVIAVIEVLSPINKLAGKGREQYEDKRLKIFGSLTNLVEIDLLRQGRPIVILNNGFKSDYRILVSRKNTRPNADLYAFNLREKNPYFSPTFTRWNSGTCHRFTRYVKSNLRWGQLRFDNRLSSKTNSTFIKNRCRLGR